MKEVRATRSLQAFFEPRSPLRILAIVTWSIFVAEAAVMLLLSQFPPLSISFGSLFDASMLVALLSPMLYFLVLRPLILYADRQKIAEQAHLKSRENLRSIIDSSSDCICHISLDGKILSMNKAGRNLNELDRDDELIGESCTAGIVENKREMEAGVEKASKGETVSLQYKSVNKKGREIWWDSKVTPIRDAEGNIKSLLRISRNITGRKKAEEKIRDSKEFVETVFNSVTDSISIINTSNFRIVGVNDSFLHTLNLEEKDVIGKCCYEVTHSRSKPCGPPNDICPLVETVKTGNHSSAEHIHYDREGNEIYVEVSTSPIRNEKGEVYQVVHSARNITGRKRAEESLKKREKQLSESQQVAKLGSWELNLISQELEWSEETYKRFDKDPESFTPSFDEFTRMVHPDDLETMQTNFNAALKSDDNPYHVEVRIINDTGREWVMEAYGEVERDKDGNPIKIKGTAQDITERKKAEESLRQSEEDWKLTFSSMSDGVSIHELDGTILKANRALGELLENGTEELIGRKCFEVFHNRDSHIPNCPMQKSRETKKSESVEYYEPGLGRWFSISASPMFDDENQVKSVVHVMRDITDKKMVDEKIHESRELLNRTIESSADAIVTTNSEGIVTTWSKGAEELYGFTPEDVLGKSIHIHYPEEFGEDRKKWHKLVTAGETLRNLETRIYNKAGELLDISLSLSPLKNADGEIIGTVGVSKDITDIKRINSEIRKKVKELEFIRDINIALNTDTPVEEVFQMVTEGLTTELGYDTSALYLTDPDRGHLTLRTYSYESSLVKKIEKLIGMKLKGYKAPIKKGTIASDIIEHQRAALTFDIPATVKQHAHNPLLKKLAPEIAKLSGIKSGVGAPLVSSEGVIGILAVGSRQKISEEDAHRLKLFANWVALAIEKTHNTERLETAYRELQSIDRLKTDIISNVSHELRTPITVIKTSLELLEDEESPEMKAHLVKLMHRAISRQNLIVDDLITSAKIQKNDLSLDLEEVHINEVATLVYSRFKTMAEERGVKLKLKSCDDLPSVKADPKSLEHILRNLVHNAIKFNHESGQVTIDAAKKNGTVQVFVKDTGVGIPRDKLDRIFEPLFQVDATTTRSFEGTGMGLATVKDLVEAQGGEIIVSNQPGGGSVFCFTIPVWKGS